MRTCILILLVGLPAGVQAQWLNTRDSGAPRTKDGKPNLSAPAPRASNGKPDLSGIWQGEGAPISELMKALPGSDGGNGLGEDIPPLSFFSVLAGVKPEESPLRPEFRAAYEKRAAAALTTPPPAPCPPPPVPFADSFPSPFKLVQTPKLTLMLYEADTFFRQIFTDGRKLPDDPQLSWLGYSVGHWQGDSLVVKTVGLIPFGPLDTLGHPHSEALRVTEQFQRRAFGHMEVLVTIDDPKTYTKPFTYKIALRLLPDTDLLESFCNEDEKDAAHMTKR